MDIPQRLAAILAADIAGYTRIMERDEAETVAAWRRARVTVIDPTIAHHQGRIVKLTGDGFLAEFTTVENAVKAALAMQDAFAALFAEMPDERRVAFRMGVNLGDVWVDADDIYGAGVNVAARLQGLAEPGGVCIAGAVHDAVKHKIAAHYEDLGAQSVKNVADPIRVWRIARAAPASAADPIARRATAAAPVGGAERKSVAGASNAPRNGQPAASSRVSYFMVAALAGGVGAVLFWFLNRDPDATWLREEAIPRIEASLDAGDWEAAYALAGEVESRALDARELADLWPRFSWLVTIESEPAGATVFRRAYNASDSDWKELGRTPLKDIRIPFGLSRLRLELDGHVPLLRTMGGGVLVSTGLSSVAPSSSLDSQLFNVQPEVVFKLDTAVTLPEGKVRVPGRTQVVGGENLQFRDYFLDRYEVTNRQFKAFVDAGGYREPKYWDPIVRDGAAVPWEEAIALFTDRTGRPGPSTWEAGDFPDGEDEFPVSGVSWYEAAAYARFMGQELPTAHHWRLAVPGAEMPWVLPASNLESTGPVAVGQRQAMNFAGTYDLIGNVREWTASAAGDRRLILGSSWADPHSVSTYRDSAAPPLDRSPNNGFRLAMTNDDPAVAARARAALPPLTPPTPESEPVSAEVYAAYGRSFAYDQSAPLNAAIEATETTRLWERQRITFDAAYGAERMVLYLYLPTSGVPPYQTVIYWPGSAALALNSIDDYSRYMDFVVKSGRAVAFPVYEGTFERGDRSPMPGFLTNAYRDSLIHGVNDLRRSIDYLETRTDVDRDAIAYFGHSWGALNGASALAQESRIRAAILYVGFLVSGLSPEVDPVNALPRVRIPVLMLSSEFDGAVPLDNARQYFELIGSPAVDKKHVIARGGHFVPRDVLIRETLDWLDEQLGGSKS